MYDFDSTLNQTKPSPRLIEVLFVSKGDSIKKQRHSLWLRYELYNLIFVQNFKYILAILLIDLVSEIYLFFCSYLSFFSVSVITSSNLISVRFCCGQVLLVRIQRSAMSRERIHVPLTRQTRVWMCSMQHAFGCTQTQCGFGCAPPNNMGLDVCNPTTWVRMHPTQ